MLTTTEATNAIAAAIQKFAAENVSLDQANGRVLRQEICAERDQPPFDRVTMDGIAIRFSQLESGQRSFTIQGQQHAGDPQQTLNDAASCIEIMTGAVLPASSDCIIPVERINICDGIAEIEPDYAVSRHQFIHPQGSDYRKNHRLLCAGKLIDSLDIAIIASCGFDKLNVSQQPAIRVISTGNELVAAGKVLEPHQIRLSNGPAIIAMLETHGYMLNQHDHLVDDRPQLEQRLARHLQESNVLILSGGVSMGKADFVPEVLAGLGVKLVFHKISQRPGKPMWFGIGPDNQAVFALPGNPVSTLVCCRQYVLPALALASGRSTALTEFAALTEPFTLKPALTCFMPVRLSSDATGRLLATPVHTNTSGDFSALSGTDGYLELAQTHSEFETGSSWPLHRWDCV